MCGIAGVVGPPSEERAQTIRAMCESIVHRGPDSEGMHEDDQVALGLRRLAIIDVDGGQQPVYSESGDIVAVFNGEIYNFRRLRAELQARGHTFRSRSDSECIPHLYEEYGLDFVDHLRGMFTIAIWDRRLGRLVLARDRLGKKPLYYRGDAAGISFASEIKALLADPRADRTVDMEAISHYLTYQYVPAPWSAVRSIRKLPPGHLLVHEPSDTRVHAYWTLQYAPHTELRTPPDVDRLAEELRERLLEAVRVRLVSERPLGAFLSGGLDSSAIVAAMSQLIPGRVKTFSIGFEEEEYDELPHARRVAAQYGTDHHEAVVRPDVLDVLPRLARSFDEPFADSSAIPSYYLAEMARRHVVVALNGDGGDEALGGYLRYPRFLQATASPLPRGFTTIVHRAGLLLHPHAGRHPMFRKASTAAILLADPDPARRYARFLSYFRPEEKARLITPDFAEQVAHSDSYRLIQRVWDAHQYTDPVNRLLAVDTATYLPGDLLTKVDITTMAVSLEARSPLLDQEFVSWAAMLPGSMKVRGGVTKWLFKRALEPWLPSDLVHRRKMGFGVPIGAWLRGPLRGLLYDVLTDHSASSRGWFEPAAVDELLQQHMSGQDRSPHLYALLMLELWVREVLEAPVQVPA